MTAGCGPLRRKLRTWSNANIPIAYAYRGLSLDSEGLNRSVNVAIPNAG